MKTLSESLFSKNNKVNKYGITKKDMKDDLKGFPIGVVIRMMEEQEAQGNKPNVKVFQDQADSDQESEGFDWRETEDGLYFWNEVITAENFDLFFKKYPEYKIYN